MTTEQLLSKVKVGDIITDKRILYALKRKGLLWEYSQWGYLEDLEITSTSDKCSYDFYFSSKANFKVAEKFENAMFEKYRQLHSETDKTYDELKSIFGGVYDTIKYNGMEFDRKFIDGCFKPYLQRIK